MPAVLDLPRARNAFTRLNELAAEHPYLLGPTGPDNIGGWIAALEEDAMEHDAQFALRLPASVIERLDALAERLRQERPGLRMSRADVTRMLILEGLARSDQEEAATARAAQGDASVVESVRTSKALLAAQQRFRAPNAESLPSPATLKPPAP
ncbi:MAG: hypothetical protein ACOYOB_17400 [Myxococcota bacterium]